ncbi:MAG: hypothetical protein ISS02_02775 [Candidatus Portnoybacteria bacterium]|nr:hypothetical protein [Candidatus Portnoybacteria bacterium]
MSHYTLCAIFSTESEEVEKEFKKLYQESKDNLLNFFVEKLKKPLAKFDTDTKVEEHIVYIDDKELVMMKNSYKEEDLKTLAGKMDDWNGNKGGVDEKGLYYNTTENPNGKFDNWNAYDILSVKEFILNINKLDRIPKSILLPNLEWIDSNLWVYHSPGKNEEEKINQWIEKIKEIMSKYPNSFVIFIDCHI